MVRTKNDEAGVDTGTFSDPGSGRCLWDETVCVDTPIHFVAFSEHYGDTAEVFCLRHYVLTLTRLCQIHLPGAEEPLRTTSCGAALSDAPLPPPFLICRQW